MRASFMESWIAEITFGVLVIGSPRKLIPKAISSPSAPTATEQFTGDGAGSAVISGLAVKPSTAGSGLGNPNRIHCGFGST